MSTSAKINLFLHENVSWKRALDFMIQENSFLKTRLSEVVDSVADPEFIAQAEHFQNEFILKDEYILDIQSDIRIQEATLREAVKAKNEPEVKTNQNQGKLRNEMNTLEKDFYILKNRFNQYLLSTV